MSFVIAVPEFLSAAATDLANLGSTISAANAAASIPTTGVLAAGADDVSAAIAALFGAHAQAYQTISAQAATFHAQFVQTLSAGAGAYANAEAANVQQSLLNAINAPTQALLGRPLIGDGADGTAPGRTRPAVTAVAVQQPACPAGLTGPGRPVGAVADQRPPQQREGGRIDRVQQLLLHVGGLGARIRTRTRGQRPHELVVKRRRRSAQRLILLGVGGKHGRHRRRHLIGTGGQQRHRRGPGRRIGRTDSRPNTRQIRRRSRHQLRGYQQIRHRTPSRNPHPVQPTLGAANRGRGESPRSAQTLC